MLLFLLGRSGSLLIHNILADSGGFLPHRNMDILNDYLKTLLSSCSDELRLEPNKNPYLVAENRTSDVAKVPLLGTQISTMVFPLIPADVKSDLPHKPEIEFVHPHQLGNFNFTVQKSPAGFNVTIRPLLGESDGSIRVPSPLPDVAPAFTTQVEEPAVAEPKPAPMPEMEMTPEPAIEPAVQTPYEFESSSSAYDLTASEAAEVASLADMLMEKPESAAEYVPTDDEKVEVVSVNDPEYQTVFSDAAPELPLRRRDDFVPAEYTPPAEIQLEQPVYDMPAFDAPVESAPAENTPMMEQTPVYTPPPAVPISAPPPAVATPVEAAFVAAPANANEAAKMDALFMKMAEIGASDLHMSVSMPPMVRKDGRMKPLQEGDAVLTPESMRALLTSIMPARNQEEFAARSDTDFAYEIPGMARFRCNIFMDRKGMGAVFRIIPSKILTAEQLNLSKAIMDLCTLSKGLVVVTGPTGSGKSTTLCAMVDSINKNREDHIITIEDPIEFVHDNQRCLVNQREVHNHTDSFKDALRAALREDPDIVLVGEMRDLETISIAIETAETGHLVFGTLHTTTAASTVDRIIDQFPADRQQQIRVMLSESLKGVIAQTLLPKKGGGRVAALEVLIVTPAISNLIREGKTFQIPSAMQTGKNHGMVMLNDALFEHVQSGAVEPMDAYVKAVDKPGFETLLTRGGFKL